ncbi:uncharacterized protein LOC143041273 [Oratosquilla oratoria]|uniref:uncharacterized protein LOC143041273 n=1 Tax=Oratosquilla oratoria TaxID=337810 RepID=UPI003F77799C
MGDSVDVVYLDCRKTFDTASLSRLLAKLETLGVRGEIYRWIQGFLRNRQQRVCVRGTCSEWLQESVLGPVLFLVFINNMLDNVQSNGKLFANSAKNYYRIRTAEDGMTPQQDLNVLKEWSQK